MERKAARGCQRLWKKLCSGFRLLGRTLREILYGMTIYDWVRELQKERGRLESLFVLAVFGDFLGVPLLPPYYTLRLLPYAYPYLSGWRFQALREKDFTELLEHEIG